MPLCPQITISPVTVTATGMTVTATDGIYSLESNSPKIQTIETNVTVAQSTADGKNKVYYSATTPAATPNTAGDIWWQYSGGVIIGQWTGAGGTSWTANTIGNAVIANLDAGKITAGYLSAARIASGTITTDMLSASGISADKITSGSLSADRISGGTISSSVIDTSGGIRTSGVISGETINSTGNVSGASISTTGNLGVTGTAVAGNLFSNGVAGVQTPGTTAETVTWRVESSGGYFMLRRPSSRRELKEHIVDIADIPELDPALLLQIPVRAYKFKPGVLDETSSRNDVFVPGFIVEEMDAIYPLAVDYDENGQPLMWGESALIPGMLALIQQQHSRIIDLEQRVTALEGLR